MPEFPEPTIVSFISPRTSWRGAILRWKKTLLVKTGLIARKTIKVPLSKVERIGVDDSVLGRMLVGGSRALDAGENFFQQPLIVGIERGAFE